MQGALIRLGFFIFFTLFSPTTSRIYNVIRHGAKGDGMHDDSPAFKAAWKAACDDNSKISKIIAPLTPRPGGYLLNSAIVFNGTCNSSSIIVEIAGTLLAPNKTFASDGWITFTNVNGLVVKGSGTINGQGSIWWPKSCKFKPKTECIAAPTLMHFNKCDKLQISGLTLQNAPKNHISINNCRDVLVSEITITSPSESPNTDGIDVSDSNTVQIQNSNIRSGDDCIAINSGTSNLNITRIACGPGHGISVGSLGQNYSWATVENIHVRDCNLTNTTNGVRIKSWQGGSGYAKDISFEDINFVGVKNPIIIDQYYMCRKGCKNETSAVMVSNVKYKGLRGTSNSVTTITLNCSIAVACTGIAMEDINITLVDDLKRQKNATSYCINAKGTICSMCAPKVNCLTPSRIVDSLALHFTAAVVMSYESSSSSTPLAYPNYGCYVPTKLYTCKKDGPYKGHKILGYKYSRGCGFFVPLDNVIDPAQNLVPNLTLLLDAKINNNLIALEQIMKNIKTIKKMINDMCMILKAILVVVVLNVLFLILLGHLL